MQQRRTKLIGISIIGLILMNFPIAGLFSRDYTLLGVPGLYVVFFLIWLGLILLTKHYTDPSRKRTSRHPKPPATP
jgi:hypothetical protein